MYIVKLDFFRVHLICCVLWQHPKFQKTQWQNSDRYFPYLNLRIEKTKWTYFGIIPLPISANVKHFIEWNLSQLTHCNTFRIHSISLGHQKGLPFGLLVIKKEDLLVSMVMKHRIPIRGTHTFTLIIAVIKARTCLPSGCHKCQVIQSLYFAVFFCTQDRKQSLSHYKLCISLSSFCGYTIYLYTNACIVLLIMFKFINLNGTRKSLKNYHGTFTYNQVTIGRYSLEENWFFWLCLCKFCFVCLQEAPGSCG